jgi:hypothetical protein
MEEIEQYVALEWTVSNFGGSRPWFCWALRHDLRHVLAEHTATGGTVILVSEKFSTEHRALSERCRLI